MKGWAFALGFLWPTDGRRIDVVNRCSRPMIIAPTGGNAQVPCGNCPGMTCNPINNQCYFDFEMPGNDWTIDPGEQISLYTPNEAVRQGNGVVADWSLNGVATAVEFTLVPFGPDFYDVSVINGFNVAIEMKPSTRFDRVSEEAAGSHKGYNCGAAGAFHQKDTRLSSCSWAFNTSTDVQRDLGPLLRQVDGNGVPCTSNSDCLETNTRCGQKAVRVRNALTGQDQPTTEIRMECGHQIGGWSIYQLCVWSGNNYVSPAPFDGLIDCPAHHQMFACAGAAPWTTTCYSQHTGSCCGCANWQQLLNTSVPKAHEGCQGSDPLWQKYAMPFLEILKRACPTAYTYAFDDESSTFTCQSSSSRDGFEANVAEYTITLCPNQMATVSHQNSDELLRLAPLGPLHVNATAISKASFQYHVYWMFLLFLSLPMRS
ncbi:unnamed protein product [Durusdinium trenchii]|uniref:Uncharacterized protein n=1 Tax=Durusdinium trenchii TaxID=1381693 RepID=A0ABP0RUX9_9DINO